MSVDTKSETVLEARRTAVELLLCEHAGDCEAPCRRACPAHMDIPEMIRRIEGGEMEAAADIVFGHIVLPAVLGRICPAPCEKACRRALHDEAVSICLLKQRVGDAALRGAPRLRAGEDTGRRAAVVGAGPAGLAAVAELRRQGHAVTLFDAGQSPGGALRTAIPEERLPREVLDAEIEAILSLKVDLRSGTEVGRHIPWQEVFDAFDAVIIASGGSSLEGLSGTGVEITERGVRTEARTLATSRQGIFAAGNAVAKKRLAVRALAHGRRAAVSAGQFLAGGAVAGDVRRFDSFLGRLDENETKNWALDASREARRSPAAGQTQGFSETEALREAGRCMACDCADKHDCRLRQTAEALGADKRAFRARRRNGALRNREHPRLVYEAGKCIRCGLCVRLSEALDEPLGLAFLGRGSALRVAPPFGRSLAEAVTKDPLRYADLCPTGALMKKRGL